MKVVASVQAKRSSSRGLVHYIAHSKTDAMREAQGRELFNEHSEQIPVEKVNDLLKTGISIKRPANHDLHHLVISLKSDDFDRLGGDERERQKSLKEITRHAMKQFQKEVGADRLAWAAGIHRNTDHPHVHIAIKKEYFDKNLEKKSLNKIPILLLPHYEKTGAEKTFKPGCLIESATEKLDEILQRKREQIKEQNRREEKTQNQSARKGSNNTQNSLNKQNETVSKTNPEISREREILAKALVAKFNLEESRENLESLEDNGIYRRFTIYDEIIGKNRAISLLDLERRAQESADRQIKKLNLTDATKKEELKKTLTQIELQQNLVGIKRIKTILHNMIVKENQTLRTREKDYHQIKALAETIRAYYKAENKKLPVPLLCPEDLDLLQAGSLEKKDIRAANYFEKVRKELSAERGRATRTDDEISRLKVQQKLSELKTKSIEKGLKEFPAVKRALTVEVDGRQTTLKKVESLIEKRIMEERKFIGKLGNAFGKIEKPEQKESLIKLLEIKTAVTEKLSERNGQLVTQLKTETLTLRTLNEFYKNETNPEKENIKAEFSAAALAEIESLAFDLKLAQVYRENFEQQKQFIENANDKSINDLNLVAGSKEKIIMGRRIAREIMCEIAVAEAKEEQDFFKKNKDFQKFEITNKKGEAKFVSLAEVRFDSRGSLFDQTLEYFLENREKRATRRALEKEVKTRGAELKENIKSAQSLLKIASDFASDFKTKSFFGAVNYLENPVFTPKELIVIELRALQTNNQSEAAKLQKILDSADHSQANNLSAILQSFDTGKENTKTVQPVSANEGKSSVKFVKDEVKPGEKDTKIQEIKIETQNQERYR